MAPRLSLSLSLSVYNKYIYIYIHTRALYMYYMYRYMYIYIYINYIQVGSLGIELGRGICLFTCLSWRPWGETLRRTFWPERVRQRSTVSGLGV